MDGWIDDYLVWTQPFFAGSFFIDSSALRFCLDVGGAWLTSLFPQVPSSEVDASVYIPFFYFSIFLQRPPFPKTKHHGRKDGRLNQPTGPRFYPYLSLNWVDRMKSNCGFLRFAGEVRLMGCDYVLDLRQTYKYLHFTLFGADSGGLPWSDHNPRRLLDVLNI